MYRRLSIAFLEPQRRELVQDQPEENDVYSSCQEENRAAGELGKHYEIADREDYTGNHHGKPGREKDLVGVGNGYHAKDEHQEPKTVTEGPQFALCKLGSAPDLNGNELYAVSCGNKAQGTCGRKRVTIRINVEKTGRYSVPECPKPGSEVGYFLL
jgi:hypothetical protein